MRNSSWFRYIIVSIVLLLCIYNGRYVAAQTSKAAKAKADSTARARQHVLDSTRTVQKVRLDSTRNAQKQRLDSTRAVQKKTFDSSRNVRQHVMDSVKTMRQHTTDSLTTIRKYRESKRYKDSVVNSRQQKINAMRSVQKARFDSIRTIRQRITDSTITIRKHTTDSIKTIQKRRSDSLGVIRKYRESKRFKDSVTIVRKVRMDSLHTVRKTYNDSVFAVRKKSLDSAKAERKRITDSATAARTKVIDSIKAVRKVKTDSLAKEKEKREKAQKVRQKQQESLANVKFELKIKQKRSVYSNEKMLKKKWSVPRKLVQNTFTHYNYYFNAKRKMDEAELNMQRLARDDYNRPIDLFSFDPDRDSTVMASDMDSVIRKASLGIQIHDPRTKWGDDLYLMLGQAYFYKGNYANALASFRYIVAMRQKAKKDAAQKKAYSNRAVRGKKEQPSVVDDDKKQFLDFLKHQSVNNDALLWVARTYTQSGKYDEAESVLDLLANNSKFPEDLKGRLALEKGFLYLKKGNRKAAATELQLVSADNNQNYWTRRRAAFLAGQLLQDQGKYLASAEQFDKVTDLQPKIEMDFYARKNRATSLMLAGGNEDAAIAALKSMLNDGKYSSYNEQIYYILGRLSLSNNNTADAVAYLQKSISSSKTTRKQKASSFALLGNVYYGSGNWTAAKNAYDSSSRLSGGASDDTLVAVARKRAKVLDLVSVPEYTIRSKDSLLALAALPEKEQRAIVRRYIRSLEKQRADSSLNAENAANAPATALDAATNDPSSMSWYFSNPSLTQQGLNEFKRKWGNRPLVDNWQRIAAVGSSGNNNNTANNNNRGNTTDAPGADESLDENGLPTEEALMARIPSTAAAKAEITKQIQRAYVDLGNAYAKGLEDYGRSNKTFDTLDSRYSTHPFGDEELYTRYMVALRQNNLPKAQQYSNELQQKYPDSKWAEMVKPANDGDGLNAGSQQTVSNYYDETYGMLMQRQYGEVLNRSRIGRQRYQDEVYGNRFRIMEAIAYAGSGNYKQADTLLNEFVRVHPTDSLRSWADNVLKYVQALKKADTLNRPTLPVDSTRRGPASAGTPPPPAQPVNSTVGNAPPGTNAPGSGNVLHTIDSLKAIAPAAYTYKASEEHYFVFYFKQMSTKVMGVKAGLGDFNTLKFGAQNLTSNLEMLQRGSEGMVISKRFSNASQAKIYMNEFRKAGALTREFAAADYEIFIISASNYLKLLADRNIQPYLTFYKGKY